MSSRKNKKEKGLSLQKGGKGEKKGCGEVVLEGDQRPDEGQMWVGPETA